MLILSYPVLIPPGANPFATLWAEELERQGVKVEGFTIWKALTSDYSAIHFHWPEHLLSGAAGDPRKVMVRLLRLASLVWARAKGAKVCWTVHDLDPHDTTWGTIDRWLFRAFLAITDNMITLSGYSKRQILQRSKMRNTTFSVIPHPIYPQTEDTSTVAPSQNTLLSFGEVRPYRGLLELVQAFAEMDQTDWTLLIVGQSHGDEYSREVAALVQRTDGVTWVDRRPSDAELDQYILSTQASVLWYRQIHNSGAALLSVSRERPVILPRNPAFEELANEIGPEWVINCERSVAGFRSALETLSQGQPAKPRLTQRDWPSNALAYKTIFARG